MTGHSIKNSSGQPSMNSWLSFAMDCFPPQEMKKTVSGVNLLPYAEGDTNPPASGRKTTKDCWTTEIVLRIRLQKPDKFEATKISKRLIREAFGLISNIIRVFLKPEVFLFMEIWKHAASLAVCFFVALSCLLSTNTYQKRLVSLFSGTLPNILVQLFVAYCSVISFITNLSDYWSFLCLALTRYYSRFALCSIWR